MSGVDSLPSSHSTAIARRIDGRLHQFAINKTAWNGAHRIVTD
jgi:hypothetical protein